LTIELLIGEWCIAMVFMSLFYEGRCFYYYF